MIFNVNVNDAISY